jgi:hypothetical protein
MKKHLIIAVIVIILVSGFEASAICFNKTNTMLLNQNTSLTWTKRLIQNTGTPSGLYAFDVDGDGKCDLLGSAGGSNSIYFWRNTGDDPIVWEEQIITSTLISACFVFCCDVDGDGDIDILGAGWEAGEISWWRNDGGTPIVWTKQIIASGYTGAHEVYSCDFDGDGDMDVFAAAAEVNKISWWRNDGGSPITWVQQIIANDCVGARSVAVSDLDSDGDLDVIGAGYESNDICWYRNDGGNPITWVKNTIVTRFNGAHHVVASDVDLDGDTDIIGVAMGDDEISWWRNDGGNPITWVKQIIVSGFSGALRVALHDIDGDGDIDCLGTAMNAGDVRWWSNDGGSPITWIGYDIDTDCFNAWPLVCADFDSDGDLDVAAGSGNAVYWYENELYPGDLLCEGSLVWSEVNPKSTITGSFLVENIGINGSQACYEVADWPSWGTWSFTPAKGVVMTGESLEVTVSVMAPDEKNKEFSGEVTVVNTHNASDVCVIQVALTTPVSYDLTPYLVLHRFFWWYQYLRDLFT